MNPASVENSVTRPNLSPLNEGNPSLQQIPKVVHTSKATGIGIGLGLASARLTNVGSVQVNPSNENPTIVDDQVESVVSDLEVKNKATNQDTTNQIVNVEPIKVNDSIDYGDVQYDDVEKMESKNFLEDELLEEEFDHDQFSDSPADSDDESDSVTEIASKASTRASSEPTADESKANPSQQNPSQQNPSLRDSVVERAKLSADSEASEEMTPGFFEKLGMPQAICNQLAKLGYCEPTPIQAATIPHILSGRDVLGQAQTGTGKTAAFALPLLAGLDAKRKKPQVLVLCPTRELAVQVAESFETYAKQMKNVDVVAIYGGQSYQPQIRSLKSGVQIVVGTPGRVMDHMKQGTLKIDELRCLVLDEADEMLRMGFIEDVQYVLSHTPEDRQIALFSATMPPAIREIADEYLRDPEVVKIQSRQTTADTVQQKYMVVPHHQKFETLARLLEVEKTDGVIVFTKTKVTTVEVADALNRRGLSASALNGDIAQSQRERTVQQMKSRKLDVLVATDVAARGLDIERVSHVINYDMPHDSEAYVHRIGRTGRAGREGVAILLTTPKESRALQFLQKRFGNTLKQAELPSINQLNDLRIAQFQKRIEDGLSHRDADFYERMLIEWAEKTGQPMSKVAAALAAMVQGDQPLLLEDLKRSKKKAAGKSSGGRTGYQCYRVAVGRRDQIQPKNIVGAIANESGIAGDEIGRIKIYESYALVELPQGIEEEILDALSSTKVGGRDMKIRLTDPAEMDVEERRPGRGSRGGNFGGREDRGGSGRGPRRGDRNSNGGTGRSRSSNASYSSNDSRKPKARPNSAGAGSGKPSPVKAGAGKLAGPGKGKRMRRD